MACGPHHKQFAFNLPFRRGSESFFAGEKSEVIDVNKKPVEAPAARPEPPKGEPMQRTLVEMRQEVERQLDAGARRIAAREGLSYHAAYARYLSTAHGEELYRLHTELPVGPLSQPETTPAQFSQPPAVEGVWAQIELLGQKKVAAGECKSLAEATSKVCTEQPELYQRYLAAGR